MTNNKFWVIIALMSSILSTSLEAAKPKDKITEKKRRSHAISSEAALNQKPFSLTLPKGWQCIDDKSQLPAKVAMIYVGQGDGSFTPSVNLSLEQTNLSLTEYVAMAKSYHEGQGQTVCHALGSVETPAGIAQVLQIDRGTQWGPVRFIQAALIKDGRAYVITGTCLKSDFVRYYPHFLQAIQSFTINSPLLIIE